jgi:DNA-binding transcriptional regulator YiaG
LEKNNFSSANDEEYGEAVKPLPFSNRLTSIQDQLSLSITQVAELFGVTRKSVYDWFDDKSMPRSATVNRAEILLDIIKESPVDIDLSRLKTVWNIPTSGRSFLAVMTDESLSAAQLKSHALEKLVELSPRLGQATSRNSDMRQGTSHLIDIDRSTDV